ncbi:MAG TPA: hypothetical protein VMP68_28550 [Candidatus Eisenbacteria bacterium]|nr:hypothetical protein [Candidatus Eisenbacteria bacterium]
MTLCIRLVFPSGAKINDASGLLQGDYGDGRRLAFFHSIEEVQSQTRPQHKAIRKWLTVLDRTESS